MTKKTYYIGLDPGASGGIAIIYGGKVIETKAMPDGPLSLWLWLSGLDNIYNGEERRYCLEKVGGYVGGAGQPGSAMFNFGQGYGHIEMLLIALGATYSNPTPQIWQKALDIPTRTRIESKEDHKRKLKTRAGELHPEAKVTLGTCDAILLAHYASLTM